MNTISGQEYDAEDKVESNVKCESYERPPTECLPEMTHRGDQHGEAILVQTNERPNKCDKCDRLLWLGH